MEKINKGILFLLFGVMFTMHAWSQTVTVNLQVSPPYSPYLSDYFSIQNKTLAIVTNLSLRGTLNLKLVGTIVGDNDIVITTGENTAGTTSFSLAPGASKTLTGNALGRLFDINNMTVSGISKQQLINGTGLPEGSYTMCIRAFSVDDNEYVSDEAPAGCSAPFSIFAVDPPIIISPLCESEVTETPSQTVVFSWTPPTRVSPNTKYLLRIAEINPNTRNPNDALLSATSPQFFEKVLTTNSYVYTLADPKLIPGRQYAFIVMAFESKSSIITSRDQLFNAYRNGGQSEVCAFTYQKNELQVLMTSIPTPAAANIPAIRNNIEPVIPPYDPEMPLNVIKGLSDLGPAAFFPFMPSNLFTGKLMYKYRSEDAGPNVEFPLKNAQIELRVKYALINNQTGEIDWEGYHPSSPKPAEGIFENPEGEVIATGNTGANGSFAFWLPEDMTFGKVSTNYQDFWYDEGGNYHSFIDNQNPGASTFHSGDLYRMVQIAVVGEHYKYYLNPKDYIDLSNEASKNATYYAYPRSKKLTVTLHTWTDSTKKYLEFLDKPAGMKVYLMRKKNMQDADIFPLGDGYGDNSGDENNEEKVTINNKEYTKVAEAISNQDGVAVFTRVIWQRPDVNDYYVYAEPPEGSQVNYYMLGKKLHYTKKYYDNGNYEKGYSYDDIPEEGIVLAGYPKIIGNVRDKNNNQPIADANVSLLEWYDISPGSSFDRAPDQQHEFLQNYFIAKDIENAANALKEAMDLWGNNYDPAPSLLPSQLPVILFQQTDMSGNFVFKDLFLQVYNSKKVTGPSRTLLVNAGGYDGVVMENLNNNTPLLYGQKLDYSIKLSKGASVLLAVADGDSGDGIEDVAVSIEGDGMAYLTGPLGFLGMPAKDLPNQKLIFTKLGYITSTVVVDIPKGLSSLGTFKLYTIKKRLDVKVINANDNTTAIPNARVEIKEVMTTCKQYNKGSGSGKFKTMPTTLDFDCPLSKLTDNYGMASFIFENAGDKFTIIVSGPSGQNYEIEQVSATIPNSAETINILVKLKPATCIKGTVYAGETNNSTVSGAVVKMKQNSYFLGYLPFMEEGGSGSTSITTDAVLQTTTGSNGSFELHNVPVRNFAQYVEGYKSESNFVGDSKKLILNTASNTCVNADLHLKVFNDMDITNLMGFPIGVTSLTSTDNKSATVSGYFTKLPEFGNQQFGVVAGADNPLSFTNLKIVADPLLKNANGIPVSKPETLPLKTNENDLHINVYGTPAVLKDNKIGVHLDKSNTNQIYGVIKGRINLPNTSINSSSFSFGEDVFLAQPGKPADEKLYIPAIYADKSVTKPVVTDKGLLVCNIDGKSAQIQLQDITQGLTADADNTWFLDGNFMIDATFHTNINTLDEPDMNIKIKGLKVNKNTGLQPFSSSQEIAANMNKWVLKSTDWSLDGQGVKLKNFNIHTNGNSGLVVPGTDITIKYSELNTNLTKVNLDALTIPGGKQIKILGGNSGFNNTLVNGKKLWQIYVNGASMNTPAAQIENLDGFNAPFKLNSIMLMNDGTQKIIMGDNQTKLHNAVDFYPTANTQLVLENSYMMIAGSLELNLPDLKKFPAMLMYKLNTNNPTIESINMNLIKWTQNGLYVEVKNPTISPGLFQAKGFVKEAGALDPLNVTLKYTPTSVDLPVDPGQKIPIQGNDKYFDDVKGEMHIDQGSKKWTTFWFDGIMKGMPGISDVNDKVTNQPQRMKMFCNGAITADAQSISVKNVETPFGNMSWTYDMPNSSLHGSCILNAFDIGGMKLNGTVETEVGGTGWYFIAGGSVQIPVLGGGNMLAFFGDYNGVPKLSGNPAGLGTYKCLPPDFQSQVKGVLISAGITKNIIDPQNYVIPVIDVGLHVHVTAGLTGRFYTSFNGSSGTNYNIGVMANVSAGGSLDLGCIDVGGNATLEASISGNYNTVSKDFSINGCASLEIGLHGEACLTPVDICPGDLECCAGCIDVVDYIKIGHLTMGAQMNANSSGDFGFDMIWDSCSNTACK